jgi:transposase
MQEAVFIGVDVSKSELVWSRHGSDERGVVANEARAIAKWLKGLPAQARVAMESTGRYHLELARGADRQGLMVYVLNALDVHVYGRALGARAKTDALDASAIARYLAEHHERLRPYSLRSPVQEEIDELLGQRWILVSKLTSLRQSCRGNKVIASKFGKLDDCFGEVIQAIDRRVGKLIASDRELETHRQALMSVTGIGEQSSAMLCNLLTRMHFSSGDALVAYSGLDPRPHDSGRSHGKRRLSKRGPPNLRRQLFMAAMAAARSKVFKPLYLQLRARGLATTEAVVVLARKLLRIVFAVWNSGQPFDPARYSSPACEKP